MPPSVDEIKATLNDPEAELPFCFFIMTDADLALRSRYSVWAFLNRGPILVRARLQHSTAVDITDSESFGFSIGAVNAEVIRGKLEDLGYAEIVEQETVIGTDNDATLRIASDAGSAKKALFLMRRLAHATCMTFAKKIKAVQIKRDLNLADAGTHYLKKDIFKGFARRASNPTARPFRASPARPTEP